VDRVDDAEIVSAIAAGNLDGLAAALERYANPLFKHCQLIAPEAAADAVREAFIVAWEKLVGLSDPDRLYPWLRALAENECFRRLHTSGAVAAPGDAPQAGAVPSELPGQVLGACADNTPAGRAYRVSMAYRAGPFGRDGFPEPRSRSAKWRRRIPWYPRAAAVVAAAVVIAVAATVITAILSASRSYQDRVSAAAPDRRPHARSAVSGASRPSAPAQQISPSAHASPVSSPAPRATATRNQPAVPAASPPAGSNGAIGGDGGDGDGGGD
jgi:hypothetical protein